jgi:hypothetical protein
LNFLLPDKYPFKQKNIFSMMQLPTGQVIYVSQVLNLVGSNAQVVRYYLLPQSFAEERSKISREIYQGLLELNEKIGENEFARTDKSRQGTLVFAKENFLKRLETQRKLNSHFSQLDKIKGFLRGTRIYRGKNFQVGDFFCDFLI